jgi:hypothetical protein
LPSRCVQRPERVGHLGWRWTPNLETNTSHGRDEFSEVEVDAAVIDAALNQQFAAVGQLMGISSRDVIRP